MRVGAVTLTAVSSAVASREVFVCIRGEEVILQRDGGDAGSVRNRLSARVVSLHPGSPLTRVSWMRAFGFLR